MNTSNTEEVKQNIITMFGIDKLPKEEQEKEMAEIGDMLFEEIILQAIPLLKAEDLIEYEKLLEEKMEPDELMDFFFDKVPNFMEIINQETKGFKEESEVILSKIKK